MARRRKEPPLLVHGPDSVAYSVQDLCRAQIDGAVEALVLRQNVVAAHVLASAAHEVMRGYAGQRGIRLGNDLHALLAEWLPEHRDGARAALVHQYNAMKHFQGGEQAVVVDPRYTEILVMLACGDFRLLFGSMSARMAIYNGWSIASGLFGGLTDQIAATFPAAAKAAGLKERSADAARMLRAMEEFGIGDDMIAADPPA